MAGKLAGLMAAHTVARKAERSVDRWALRWVGMRAPQLADLTAVLMAERTAAH